MLQKQVMLLANIAEHCSNKLYVVTSKVYQYLGDNIKLLYTVIQKEIKRVKAIFF